MTIFQYRRWQLLLTFVSLLVLGGSFYFQYVKGLEPCPLCLMQRLCVFLLFFFGFLATCVGRLQRARFLVALQILVGISGLFFAGRQLWLLSLPPDSVPACMPGLNILIRYFPWQEVAHALFWGTGECTEVSWHWLGLSMPAWTALYFALMTLTAFFLFIGLHRQLRSLKGS